MAASFEQQEKFAQLQNSLTNIISVLSKKQVESTEVRDSVTNRIKEGKLILDKLVNMQEVITSLKDKAIDVMDLEKMHELLTLAYQHNSVQVSIKDVPSDVR